MQHRATWRTFIGAAALIAAALLLWAYETWSDHQRIEADRLAAIAAAKRHPGQLCYAVTIDEAAEVAGSAKYLSVRVNGKLYRFVAEALHLGGFDYSAVEAPDMSATLFSNYLGRNREFFLRPGGRADEVVIECPATG